MRGVDGVSVSVGFKVISTGAGVLVCAAVGGFSAEHGGGIPEAADPAPASASASAPTPCPAAMRLGEKTGVGIIIIIFLRVIERRDHDAVK